MKVMWGQPWNRSTVITRCSQNLCPKWPKWCYTAQNLKEPLGFNKLKQKQHCKMPEFLVSIQLIYIMDALLVFIFCLILTLYPKSPYENGFTPPGEVQNNASPH
jgi:hypothetical protein